MMADYEDSIEIDPACNPLPPCQAPPPCDETFSTQCIISNAADKLCGLNTVYAQGDSQEVINGKIVDYFCNQLGNIQAVTSVTGNIVDNTDALNPVINLYEANTIFVDANYGNDSTGQYENPARPFATIDAAYQFLFNNIIGGTQVVKVRPGFHFSNIQHLSQNFKSVFSFEDGSLISEFGVRDTFGVAEFEIHGQGCQFFGGYFNSNFIGLVSGSSVGTVKIGSINKQGSFGSIIAVANGFSASTLVFEADTIYHNDFSGSFVTTINLRGYANVTITAHKEIYSSCRGRTVYVRNDGPVGDVKLHITTPQITQDGIGDIFQFHDCLDTSKIVVRADRMEQNQVGSGVAAVWCACPGQVEIYGNLVVNAANSAVWVSGASYTLNKSSFKFFGVIYSKVAISGATFNCSTNTCRIEVIGAIMAVDSRELIYIQSASGDIVVFRDCLMKHFGTNGRIARIDAGCTFLMYNVTAEAGSAVTESIFSSAATAETVRLNNVALNIALDPNVTNAIATGNVVVDNSIYVPYLEL